jgi:hypothetical protein
MIRGLRVIGDGLRDGAQGQWREHFVLNFTMDLPLYQSSDITITPTEIRAKGFTLYLQNVTSVSIGTIRPGKWVPLLSLPLVAMIWLLGTLSPFGAFSGRIFLPMIPLIALDGVLFLLRISRLYLQTTGGPVVLAYNVCLWEPTEVIARYERIKRAIEKGISAQQAPVIVH